MPLQHAVVGRQPILDRDQQVYGHELLYRSSDGGGPMGVDGDTATSTVVLSSFLDLGLEHVVGRGRAFINVTRAFLLAEEAPPFPPGRVVMEVLEHEAVDTPLIDAVTARAAEGYEFALDDFVWDRCWEPLLPLVGVVKVEIPALDERQTADHVERLRRYDVKLLAEKVETEPEYLRLHALGFDLFQGYFFARPELVSGQRMADNRVATLRLLSVLQRAEIDLGEVDRLVSQDVGLSYKLLRYINSAFFALPQPVESIRRAVVFLGLATLKRIVMLAAIAGGGGGPSELIRVALVRARMCELLCERRGGLDTDSGFTIGLFSMLEAMIGAPLPEILDKLPLADDISAALLAHQGPFGTMLAATLAYERCDWDDIAAGPLPLELLAEVYPLAVDWAYQASAELLG